ncbi:Pro-interleukin-16 [Chionoecetes opilio]|uniref:Pro-interleukin-16 n=1 Tax=Chionoecetes opilio TaxID=41210 RepID=A0A8J4YTZ8_CHIOP|nr:Pro-interleukin-16 [Chionoecetes opilio]
MVGGEVEGRFLKKNPDDLGLISPPCHPCLLTPLPLPSHTPAVHAPFSSHPCADPYSRNRPPSPHLSQPSGRLARIDALREMWSNENFVYTYRPAHLSLSSLASQATLPHLTMLRTDKVDCGGGSVSVATCEHRYSSSGGAPPPYSRLPPDGHEFPSNYAEGLPDKMSRFARYSRLAMELDSPGSPPSSATSTPRTRSAPGTPLGPPPPIPRSSPTASKTYNNERTSESGNNKWTGNEERKSREPTPTRGRWRRQDEKSEKSVRDKIAMFSTDGPDQPHSKTRKLDKQEEEEGTMKRAFTEDDVRLDNSASSITKSGREVNGSSRSLSKTSVFSSMINVSTSEPKDNAKNISTASSEVDIRQDTPPTPHSQGLREEKKVDDESSTNGLHSRSQSLVDIGRSTLTKRHSVGAYDRPSVYQYGIEKPEERERRTSLTNLIEQRRKSFGSKLLGLVIPENRGSEGTDKASIDLPRISSVPPTAANKTMSLPREGQRSPRLYKTDSISSIDSCESNTSSRHSSLNAPPWKSHGTSTLPKYSPAFKRKNMTVFNKADNLPPLSGRSHSACSTSPTSDLSQASPTHLSHSPPKSLETISPPSSEHTYDMTDGRYNSDRNSYSKVPFSHKNSMESRFNRAEDSDNDSAVSSTQSSYSQGMSPPSSPMPDQDELEDRRGTGYRSRLSQQNSLDDQDAVRRVLKRGSIEAENRRNVIISARVSSGKNSDENMTPEIIRKYSSTSDREDSDRFPQRLDSELREGPKVTGLRRQTSTSSTSSTASSRRSSHDSSRRNSKDSLSMSPTKVSAEPVYFDQEGEMYKEDQLKIAYVNEITDNFEQLKEPNNKEVIAEVPLSSSVSRRIIEASDSSDSSHSSQPVSCHSRRGGNRWAELEMKYGTTNSNSDIESKIQRMRRASDSSSPDRTKKKSGGFRALAERWQQRAEEDTSLPPQPTLAHRESNSRIEAPTRSTRQYEEHLTTTSTLERPARPSRLYDDQANMNRRQSSQPNHHSESSQSNSLSSCGDTLSENLDIPRAEVPDRKLSMPEYGNGGIKMRDRREGGPGGVPSRPTSLIEGGDGGVIDSNYLSGCAQLSPTASTDSRDDLFTPETSLSRTSSKEVLDAFSRPRAAIGVSFPRVGASTTPKIDDIMRAFERHDMRKRGTIGGGSSHPRMSSLDSTNSDEGLIGAHYGSVTSLASGQRDQYGSITSLASSTSLISPQELAQLIEEANQSLEESGTPSHEILVVVLHREIVGHGSIGITLAGGADYETKEITVHKVIPGSLADRDGRIQRGDRVLSINGRNLRGVTHKEALSILKSPRPEVVLVLSRSRSVTPQESNMTESDGNFSHRPSLINHITSPRPPKILESPMDSKSLISAVAAMSIPRGPPFTITLVKDGAGLGFSLEGGKDSPLGDRPLTVKKIFSGGAADKGGILKVGDELVSVNTVDVTGMARIEAWNFLKKLPDGTVSLVLRQKLESSSAKNEEYRGCLQASGRPGEGRKQAGTCRRPTELFAVVTGGNNVMGYAIMKELCAKFEGRMYVYLTTRDEGRAEAAVEILKEAVEEAAAAEAVKGNEGKHVEAQTDNTPVLQPCIPIKGTGSSRDLKVSLSLLYTQPSAIKPSRCCQSKVKKMGGGDEDSIQHECEGRTCPHRGASGGPCNDERAYLE